MDNAWLATELVDNGRPSMATPVSVETTHGRWSLRSTRDADIFLERVGDNALDDIIGRPGIFRSMKIPVQNIDQSENSAHLFE